MLKRYGEELVGLAVLGLALLGMSLLVAGSGPTPISGLLFLGGIGLLGCTVPPALLVGAILLVRRLLGWNGRRAGGRVPAQSATGWRPDLDGAPHEVWAWASATTRSGIRALVDGQYQTAVVAARANGGVGVALSLPGHELRVTTATDWHLPLAAVNGQPGPAPLRLDLFVDGRYVPPWAYADGDGGIEVALAGRPKHSGHGVEAASAGRLKPADHGDDAASAPRDNGDDVAPMPPITTTPDGRQLRGRPPARR